jgi:hypothetical protein
MRDETFENFLTEKRGMVDVCGGKMDLKKVNREINYYVWNYKPRRIIIDIQRMEGGYYATLYIPRGDFNTKEGVR